MSGGSFNYLCYKEGDELIDNIDWFFAMKQTLSEEYDATQAVAEMSRIEDDLQKIRVLQSQMQTRMNNLHDVWRAVEWEHSLDTVRENTLKVIETYNKKVR